jgi:hypothetical protein
MDLYSLTIGTKRIMSGMPKLENKQSNKILIITEEQAKEILKHL